MTRALALLLLLLTLTPPAVAADDAGATLYRRNCSACHGRPADNPNAPDVAWATLADIRAARREIEEMRKLRLSHEDEAAIADYFASLR
ncbi:cytochrome c [Rhodovulum sp. P5]|uniref:c-type cytochrome n=1 Tax=Rhodovulum sp. P5 TaxID=1564506 RepID=UPI0012EC5645|nr:cytochrome c [Rhodovulum sp. P5]